MRCICPPDSVPIGARLEAGEADRLQRMLDGVALLCADAAEQPGPPQQPHADEIEHRDRKRAVDVGDLRQVGDVARA